MDSFPQTVTTYQVNLRTFIISCIVMMSNKSEIVLGNLQYYHYEVILIWIAIINIATFSKYRIIAITALLYSYCTPVHVCTKCGIVSITGCFFYEGNLLVLKTPFTIKLIESSYVASIKRIIDMSVKISQLLLWTWKALFLDSLTW